VIGINAGPRRLPVRSWFLRGKAETSKIRKVRIGVDCVNDGKVISELPDLVEGEKKSKVNWSGEMVIVLSLTKSSIDTYSGRKRNIESGALPYESISNQI